MQSDSDAQAAACDGAAAALPEEASAQVNDLAIKMRYFKAIGFHKQSNEEREEIAAIYAKHGVALPKEFQE